MESFLDLKRELWSRLTTLPVWSCVGEYFEAKSGLFENLVGTVGGGRVGERVGNFGRPLGMNGLGGMEDSL